MALLHQAMGAFSLLLSAPISSSTEDICQEERPCRQQQTERSVFWCKRVFAAVAVVASSLGTRGEEPVKSFF